MELAGGEKEGDARAFAARYACEEDEVVNSVAEFTGKLEKGERVWWARGGRRRWTFSLQVGIWEGVYKIGVPFDHVDRRRRQ